jgi:ATP-binding cassette subfamily B protein
MNFNNRNTTDKHMSLEGVKETLKCWPRIFKLLWEIDKVKVIIITLTAIFLGVFPAIMLIITQNLINSVIYNANGDFSVVIGNFILMVCISLLTEIVTAIQTYSQGIFQTKLGYKLNIKLMEKAVRLSLKDFENSEIYDKFQRAQNEVGYRPFQIYRSILTVLGSFITLISAAVILILWKWWIILALLLVPIVSTIYSVKIGKREYLIQWKRAPRFRKAWYYVFLVSRDINYKEIKLYGIGNYLLEKYSKIFDRYLKTDKKVLKIRNTITFIFNLIMNLMGDGIILLIMFSAFRQEFPLGNLISYIRAVSMTETNFQGILNTLFSMYQDTLYIQQLFEFLDLEETEPLNEEQNSEKEYKKIDSIERIEFQNVSFRYPGSKDYALRYVSFEINRGEIIAIVGENGSGKTTMVKLLTRLYDLEDGNGKILINDTDIKEYKIDEIRKTMGVVFQDFVKYELKVRHNIGFGNIEDLNKDEKIEKSAKEAGIENIIKKLPDKLDTQLGLWFSQGKQLSGGQWQKIAIARAFFREAQIYILDEPSSALDPLAEKDVFQQFFESCENKIGIFTSHRFSTVKYATNILVFDGGYIIEDGTHDELMEFDGHYKKLYEIQASPFNMEIVNK